MTGEGRLADQVFEWITAQILLGGLKPGQWISETEIAETLGVSRSPVHQALQGLSAGHLVTVVPRRGTMIADVDLRDVDEVYRARAFIDGEIARLAVLNAPDALPPKVKSATAELQASIGDIKRYFEATERFWGALHRHCGNSVLVDISVSLWRRSIPIRGVLLRQPGRQERTYESFAGVEEAVARHDAEAASLRTAELFDDIRMAMHEKWFMPVWDDVDSARALRSR